MLAVLLANRVGEVFEPDALWPPSITRLMASFLARRTMFSIIAPDAKSLKNMSLCRRFDT